MRGRPHPASTTRKSTAGGSGSRGQTSRACASAASSDDAGLRALLVGGDDQVRQALQDLDGELRAVPDEPLEPLVPDDEELGVARGDGARRPRSLPEERHLAEELALPEPVERLLCAVEATADLDRARVDHVRLAARVVALSENDLARVELPPLDVAEREVLVDLEADRWQGGLGLDGQPRIGPAAEPTLEDPHVLEAALTEPVDDARARRLFRARAVRDEELVGLEVQVRRLRALRIEPDGAGQLEWARLVVILGPHVEEHGAEPALDEGDHLRRLDAEPVLPPPLAPHAAVGAEREQRDAEGRPRPGERLRRRVLHLVLGFGEQPLDVGEPGKELVRLG